MYLKMYQCPCCECFTYNVPPKEDCGYICPVCFWENDPFITSGSDPSDLNHGITLNEAKNNYLEFGACEREMLRYVRPPESNEKQTFIIKTSKSTITQLLYTSVGDPQNGCPLFLYPEN